MSAVFGYPKKKNYLKPNLQKKCGKDMTLTDWRNPAIIVSRST